MSTSIEPDCEKLIRLTEGVKLHLDKMHSILSKIEDLEAKIGRVMKENQLLRNENKYLRAKITERTELFHPRARF